MEEQIKVFKPSRQAKILFLMAEAFVVFVLFGLIGFGFAFNSGMISLLIWVFVLFISLLVFRLFISERLRVTKKEIEENYVFRRRRVLLSSIQGIRVGYKTSRNQWIFLIIDLVLNLITLVNWGNDLDVTDGGDARLFIKTNDGEVIIGAGVDYQQLNEAMNYIVEQVSMFYPENYVAIEREERQRKEEKRLEELQAVQEFWSK